MSDFTDDAEGQWAEALAEGRVPTVKIGVIPIPDDREKRHNLYDFCDSIRDRSEEVQAGWADRLEAAAHAQPEVGEVGDDRKKESIHHEALSPQQAKALLKLVREPSTATIDTRLGVVPALRAIAAGEEESDGR